MWQNDLVHGWGLDLNLWRCVEVQRIFLVVQNQFHYLNLHLQTMIIMFKAATHNFLCEIPKCKPDTLHDSFHDLIRSIINKFQYMNVIEARWRHWCHWCTMGWAYGSAITKRPGYYLLVFFSADLYCIKSIVKQWNGIYISYFC